ncbi:MAG: adenosylmethionine decarboxylase [Vulcanimicrobiota bacterium]
MKAFGLHYIIELSGCEAEIIKSEDKVRDVILEAARKARAQIRGLSVHEFKPHGVSGVVVIAESHLSIHTWPEYHYAAIDIFTCGDSTEPQKACEFMEKELKSEHSKITVIRRGIKDRNNHRTHKIFE